MALSIKTEEADRLARDLARLTGETMTQAVTVALRERLERQRSMSVRSDSAGQRKQIDSVIAVLRSRMDLRPISGAELQAAGADDWDEKLT